MRLTIPSLLLCLLGQVLPASSSPLPNELAVQEWQTFEMTFTRVSIALSSLNLAVSSLDSYGRGDTVRQQQNIEASCAAATKTMYAAADALRRQSPLSSYDSTKLATAWNSLALALSSVSNAWLEKSQLIIRSGGQAPVRNMLVTQSAAWDAFVAAYVSKLPDELNKKFATGIASIARKWYDDVLKAFR